MLEEESLPELRYGQEKNLGRIGGIRSVFRMALVQRKSRPASRAVAVVFGVVMAIAGLGILGIAGIPQGWEVWKVRHWEEVPCDLKRADIQVNREADDKVNVQSIVAYTYQWKEKEHSSETTLTPVDVNERERELAELRASAKTCLVNPDDPSESRVERPSWLEPLILIGAGAVTALAGILVAWRPKVSDRAGTRLLRWVVPACLLIFAGSGALCIWLAVRDDWKSVEPRLKEVPCTIVASGVKTSRGSGSRNANTNMYSPDILFRYEWEGRTWHSTWVDFSRNSVRSSDAGSSRETVNRYPEGSAHKCWLDPAKPWVAVLEKKYGPVWVLWLCGSVFGAIGVLGLALWFSRGFLFRRFRKPAHSS